MTLYPKLILDALATVRYPGTGKNLVEAEMVADNMRIDGMKVSFSLTFEKPTDPFMKSMVKAAETAIHTYVSPEVEVVITTESRQAARPEVGKLLPQVKNVIGVSSGKGGVGKSTVAANLAVSLAKLGYKVGLLDADIFGPSVPKMFQVEDARPVAENIGGRDLIVPIEKYGIKLLSIGFFVDPDQATLWRGGMASNALKQLIGDADWGELDYFLIDLPPGTSDIHLTVVQVLDYFTPMLGSKYSGGSKWGNWGCIIGTLVGLLFLPWGVILGPFLGAVIGELLGNKEFSQALKSGVGSLIGFILGTLLKFVVCGYFCYQFILGFIK